MIRLTTVGTGTVSPSATRSSPAHWIEASEQTGRRADAQQSVPTLGSLPDCPSARLLLDCGAGTVHRLAKLGLPWRDPSHIVITHFHADHLGELPALLFAMKYGAMEPRTAPLALIGPAGLRRRLEGFAAALGDWVLAPGFPLTLTEIDPLKPTRATLVTGITLETCKTAHTDESFAVAIATSAGRLVYTADTGPSDALGDWASGCDLLLAECSLPERMAMAIHLTPRGAAELALRARAKRLVLTHLYPPVETEDILGIVRRVYAGPTVVAQDGDRFEVGTTHQ